MIATDLRIVGLRVGGNHLVRGYAPDTLCGVQVINTLSFVALQPGSDFGSHALDCATCNAKLRGPP